MTNTRVRQPADNLLTITATLLLLSVASGCSTALEPLGTESAATPSATELPSASNASTTPSLGQAAPAMPDPAGPDQTRPDQTGPDISQPENTSQPIPLEETDTEAPEANTTNSSTPDSDTNASTPEPIATAPDTLPSSQPTLTIALDGSCDTNSDVLTHTMQALFNDVRQSGQQCGNTYYPPADPLAVNDTLTNVAQQHSTDMAARNFFSHTGSDGLSASNRVDNSGYDWSAIGENIAAGQRTIETAVQGWIQSPGHCANIMSQNFTEFGAACVEDAGSDYESYWTAVYARSF